MIITPPHKQNQTNKQTKQKQKRKKNHCKIKKNTHTIDTYNKQQYETRSRKYGMNSCALDASFVVLVTIEQEA